MNNKQEQETQDLIQEIRDLLYNNIEKGEIQKKLSSLEESIQNLTSAVNKLSNRINQSGG